ncbi:hypothetical protein F2Q69_00024418 [Brassica cretica]|uniref:Uncharacterized protein n=1 Tax=Brassica cretica TaxID=69181 RepID=A0A8S9QHE1_BRACR|nr:hypothetical protein F2Q69_00024418 [Brassica cretica]
MFTFKWNIFMHGWVLYVDWSSTLCEVKLVRVNRPAASVSFIETSTVLNSSWKLGFHTTVLVPFHDALKANKVFVATVCSRVVQIVIQAFPTTFFFTTMTLQYGLHCGACELELRFMFNTQSCANDSFPAAIREGEIAFESRNLFCVICVVHRLPQFSCGGVSSLALGQVLVVDGIIQMVPYAHVYIYFRKVQGFIVMCVIKFQRRDGLKMKSQRSKKQYVMCGTTFTMINSSSKVREEDDIACRNVHVWFQSCFFTPWFSLNFSGHVLVLGDLAEMMYYHSNPLQDGSLSKISTRIKGTVGSTPWSLKDTWHENLMVLLTLDLIHVLPRQQVLRACLLLLVIMEFMSDTLLISVETTTVSTCGYILADAFGVICYDIILLDLLNLMHAEVRSSSCAVAFSRPHVSLVGYFMVSVIVHNEESAFTCPLWVHNNILCLLQTFKTVQWTFFPQLPFQLGLCCDVYNDQFGAAYKTSTGFSHKDIIDLWQEDVFLGSIVIYLLEPDFTCCWR